MTTRRGQAVGWFSAGIVLMTSALAGCQIGQNGDFGQTRARQGSGGNAMATTSSSISGPASDSPNVFSTPVALKPYGGQRTCPVMGDKLDSMGPPVAVTVKGEKIFVCCQGCIAKVKGNPDMYLAKVMAERRAP